jgi:DNA invertase Pin-like site-specific DNA recombinase
MIAAIYRGNRRTRTFPDAEKSVTRQVEHATAYATRKGWTVDPAHVYQDDGISGAEFVKRPGFLRLMTRSSPGPRSRCSSCPRSPGSGARTSRPAGA